MKRATERIAISLCAAAGVGAGAILGRSKLLHWGATSEEVREPLPGDSLVPDPHLTATRAITIHRGAAEVWPWIAQLGQGRGGFYSYDRLENLVGAHIHNADEIVTAWQDVHVGDEVHLAPEVALAVAVAEVPVALVLRGGVAMGGTPSPYDFSWVFVLREEPEGVTRLVVRERYRYLRGWARFIVEPVAVVSFVMTQKMLRGSGIGRKGCDSSVRSLPLRPGPVISHDHAVTRRRYRLPPSPLLPVPLPVSCALCSATQRATPQLRARLTATPAREGVVAHQSHGAAARHSSSSALQREDRHQQPLHDAAPDSHRRPRMRPEKQRKAPWVSALHRCRRRLQAGPPRRRDRESRQQSDRLQDAEPRGDAQTPGCASSLSFSWPP